MTASSWGIRTNDCEINLSDNRTLTLHSYACVSGAAALLRHILAFQTVATTFDLITLIYDHLVQNNNNNNNNNSSYEQEFSKPLRGANLQLFV